MSDLTDLVDDVTTLVSLPEVAMRVTQMVEDPDVSIDEIGSYISKDPSLTAKILKISNSAMYGFVSKIDTVPRAITMLGTRQIRDLVLATSAFQTFNGISNTLVTMEDFWQHSILCGLAANQLTRLCGLRNGDGLFVAGLLHDIGQLIMFNRMPDKSQKAILMSMEGEGEPEMYVAEQKIFGFNHMDVGKLMAEKWQLPAYLQYAIGYHHHPEQSPDFKQEVSIVHIANTIAVLAELDSDDPELGPGVSDFAWQQTGLDETVFAKVAESILDEYEEIAHLFELE